VLRCCGLILDLRDLDFFGTEGFSALHRVSVCCARAGIGWVVVPGEAVSRVLRIGDPQGLLPAALTVEAAMATVERQPRRPLQPVARRRDPAQSLRCERTVCLVCGGTQPVRHEQRTSQMRSPSSLVLPWRRLRLRADSMSDNFGLIAK